jgi:hypothetical protein
VPSGAALGEHLFSSLSTLHRSLTQQRRCLFIFGAIQRAKRVAVHSGESGVAVTKKKKKVLKKSENILGGRPDLCDHLLYINLFDPISR